MWIRLILCLWFCYTFLFRGYSTDEGLFGCHDLSSAHYNFLKTPGESVIITCPKNCSTDSNTQWYHSYIKKKVDLDLLVWSGLSHEAAVKETPSHGSVGYFCCVCEEEEDPASDGCCWGVAYQPVVNLTIAATNSLKIDDETIALVDTSVTLRCEARGFPELSVTVTHSTASNELLSGCREIEKSWYSSVVTCQWSASEALSGVFECTGSILIDSSDSHKIMYNTTTSQELSVCSSVPNILHFYQANKLEVGSQLDLVCEIDCCHIETCSVMWYFRAVAIDTTNSKYKLSSEDGLVHTLSLLDPGREDLGSYQCVLTSPLGDDKRTLTLALPDGFEPDPGDNLPGPVTDNVSPTTTTTVTLAVMWTTFTFAVLAITTLAFVLCRKSKSKSAEQNELRSDNIDKAILIPSSSDDVNRGEDVERDSVSSRRRQKTQTNKLKLSKNNKK